jgi:hypothetical protein
VLRTFRESRPHARFARVPGRHWKLAASMKGREQRGQAALPTKRLAAVKNRGRRA